MRRHGRAEVCHPPRSIDGPALAYRLGGSEEGEEGHEEHDELHGGYCVKVQEYDHETCVVGGFQLMLLAE